VKLLNAALAAEYAGIFVRGVNAFMDEMFDDGSPALLDHPSTKGLGHEKCAHEIEIKNLPKPGGIEIEK